ncbi:hypothetical protein PEC301899_03150 [Pectobacterium carotovorum subsp. carotovorum]|nr:hypothetical protein PEC301899_03150 [Pectobacterium carotovorum subsp. carotovorum]
MTDKNKEYNMIDEFHVIYMYRKIQVEAATTDLKTLEQLLKKFRKVVAEHREEYYQEIGEKKARKLRVNRMQKIREQMGVTVFYQRSWLTDNSQS